MATSCLISISWPRRTRRGLTARISVTGPAAHPAFAISSNPSLPEDEILSRVLFQRSSGSLSPFQALELANAVGTLSGQADAFESMRKSLGVDSLDISTSATGDPLVSATHAINDRVERRRDDRSETSGQRRITGFRRHPPYPAKGRRRRERRIGRRRRRRLGVQINELTRSDGLSSSRQVRGFHDFRCGLTLSLRNCQGSFGADDRF